MFYYSLTASLFVCQETLKSVPEHSHKAHCLVIGNKNIQKCFLQPRNKGLRRWFTFPVAFELPKPFPLFLPPSVPSDLQTNGDLQFDSQTDNNILWQTLVILGMFYNIWIKVTVGRHSNDLMWPEPFFFPFLFTQSAICFTKLEKCAHIYDS